MMICIVLTKAFLRPYYCLVWDCKCFVPKPGSIFDLSLSATYVTIQWILVYYYILKTSTNLCFLLFVLGVRVRVLCARALRSLRTSGRPRWWLGWRLGLAWCSLCHATVTLNILGRQQHLQTPGSQNKSIASSGHKSHLRSDPQSSVMLYNRRGAVLHTEGTESEKLIWVWLETVHYNVQQVISMITDNTIYVYMLFTLGHHLCSLASEQFLAEITQTRLEILLGVFLCTFFIGSKNKSFLSRHFLETQTHF